MVEKSLILFHQHLNVYNKDAYGNQHYALWTCEVVHMRAEFAGLPLITQ